MAEHDFRPTRKGDRYHPASTGPGQSIDSEPIAQGKIVCLAQRLSEMARTAPYRRFRDEDQRKAHSGSCE